MKTNPLQYKNKTFRCAEKRFHDHFHKVEVAAQYRQHVAAAARGDGHVSLQEGRVAVLLDGILLPKRTTITVRTYTEDSVVVVAVVVVMVVVVVVIVVVIVVVV